MFDELSWERSLKGQCHEIFCFWSFSWISFPPAPEYSLKAVSNFFENSRRYLQLKVCHRCQRHRWQMEKISNQKNFNNFVWSPLGSRGNIYINFCLQAHLQVSAARYCSHYLPPVSMTPVANLPPVPVSLIPVANLLPVSLIPAAICHRCLWHRWCTLTCEYIREFSKKFEMILMLLSGAWGKVIHEKNLKQKISWHCPFKKKNMALFERNYFQPRIFLFFPDRDWIWILQTLLDPHWIRILQRLALGPVQWNAWIQICIKKIWILNKLVLIQFLKLSF